MVRHDLSFLAPPGEAADWRMVVVYDAAADAGVLSALPGTPEEAAAARGLDAHATRVVLEQLAVWDIVEVDHHGRYALGVNAPDRDLHALLRHHARSLRLWSTGLDNRLRGVAPAPGPRSPGWRQLWYDALAAFARPTAPAVIDACLAGFPTAQRVLDLGGGHGEHALEFARRGCAVTLQDQAETIELARQAGRLETSEVGLFAGDFFETLPDGPFDLVFAAAVTDTYNHQRNAELAQRTHAVLTSGGGVAILAFVHDRDPAVPAFAVQMLSVGSGGDTHSEAHYRQWLDDAGFHDLALVDVDDRPQTPVLATR